MDVEIPPRVLSSPPLVLSVFRQAGLLMFPPRPPFSLPASCAHTHPVSPAGRIRFHLKDWPLFLAIFITVTKQCVCCNTRWGLGGWLWLIKNPDEEGWTRPRLSFTDACLTVLWVSEGERERELERETEEDERGRGWCF